MKTRNYMSRSIPDQASAATTWFFINKMVFLQDLCELICSRGRKMVMFYNVQEEPQWRWRWRVWTYIGG
ncbi:hypothetical protein HanIR_Chr16g0839881 [Helianthus annuus]|nr:hypothetical protein HanIR_Chr16g0839881 [Helianthus annuus]